MKPSKFLATVFHLPPLPVMEPPTLEELVKKAGISVDLLDQPCSDEHLKSISLFLHWRNVTPHLGLSEVDIEDIKSGEGTEPERRLKALLKWKTKYSFKATLKILVEVLLMVGNADNAGRVCYLLKSQVQEGINKLYQIHLITMIWRLSIATCM